MMADDDAHRRLDAALDAMGSRALENALQRVVVIENAVGELQRGCLDDQTCETAQHDAHKIAGSAGMFGFSDAGESARELELIFSDVVSAEAAQERATTLLASLKASLDPTPGHGTVEDF